MDDNIISTYNKVVYLNKKKNMKYKCPFHILALHSLSSEQRCRIHSGSHIHKLQDPMLPWNQESRQPIVQDLHYPDLHLLPTPLVPQCQDQAEEGQFG